MKRFKDKVVVINGACSSIGEATAIRFAQEGAKLVLLGQHSQTLESLIEALPKPDQTWIHTDNHLAITCDLSNHNQLQAMIEHIIARFNAIHAVVNISNTITEPTQDNSQDILQSILDSIIQVSQSTLPALIASHGHIVNVSTPLSLENEWNNYLEEKVNKLTHALAIEHGKDCVNVNAVNTGFLDENKLSKTHDIHAEHDKVNARCPLGKLATTKDIAAAITFLASEDAALITGANLPVAGGGIK